MRRSEYCGILNIKKDICANRCPTGAADRRLARFISLQLIAAYLVTGWRLLLCLVTIFTKRVSDSKAGQAEAQHRNQSQNIHMAQPSFPRFPYGFLCNRRVTVPPERANRLPSWQSQINITTIRQEAQSDFPFFHRNFLISKSYQTPAALYTNVKGKVEIFAENTT